MRKFEPRPTDAYDFQEILYDKDDRGARVTLNRNCPSCGAEGIPEAFRYCGACGAELGDNGASASSEGAETASARS